MNSNLFSNAKKSYEDYQEKKAKERAEYEKKVAKEKADEEARKMTISSGDIKPITTHYNLDKDEKAYVTFQAQKMGQVETAVNVTQRQDVASRASCGCCLLGPLGALLGGVTAPSKTNQIINEALTTLDRGTMVFTNKRFLFIGDNSMTGLIYENVLSINFNVRSSETDLDVNTPK